MNLRGLNDYKKEGRCFDMQIKETRTKKRIPPPTQEDKVAEWRSSILMFMASCKRLRKIPSK